MIAGLVLAAGAGRRLGTPKAAVLLGGVRLVDRAVYTLRAGGCDEVVAVVRSEELTVPGARTVVNPEADSGMGSSLRAGLAALHPDTDAVVVTLVDLPDVAATEVAALLGWYRNGASIVAARRGGVRSHPVLVARRWLRAFGEAAQGDQGARTFFGEHADEIDYLDFPGTISDIDTPEDLHDAERRFSPSG